MMGSQILIEFAALVEEIGEVPADSVTPEKSFIHDLDLDSLAMVELAVAVKEKWGIPMSAENLHEFRTVQDVLDRIEQTGAD